MPTPSKSAMTPLTSVFPPPPRKSVLAAVADPDRKTGPAIDSDGAAPTYTLLEKKTFGEEVAKSGATVNRPVRVSGCVPSRYRCDLAMKSFATVRGWPVGWRTVVTPRGL